MATIAVRRSHRFCERASAYSGARGLSNEVAADHVRRAEVDEVPVVDPVVPPEVELVERRALLRRRALAARLLVHHAQRADAHLVLIVVEQRVDRFHRQVDVLLGEGEDVAHPEGLGEREQAVREGDGGLWEHEPWSIVGGEAT